MLKSLTLAVVGPKRPFDRSVRIDDNLTIAATVTHEEAERDDFNDEAVEPVVKNLEDLGQLNLRNGK